VQISKVTTKANLITKPISTYPFQEPTAYNLSLRNLSDKKSPNFRTPFAMEGERAILEELRKKWGAGISLQDSSIGISNVTEYICYKTLEYKFDNLQDDDFWDAF
jgi:hypothetical protein